MNTYIRALLVPLLASLAFTAAQAAPRGDTGADYGKVVASKGADKTVRIDASTRAVNVADGDTVRFEVDQQAFTFAFDTYPGDQSVDLQAIAPKDLAVPHVRVYVAASQRYVQD